MRSSHALWIATSLFIACIPTPVASLDSDGRPESCEECLACFGFAGAWISDAAQLDGKYCGYSPGNEFGDPAGYGASSSDTDIIDMFMTMLVFPTQCVAAQLGSCPDSTPASTPAPTTTPTPAPTSGNGGGAVGDPHVFGPHGDLYDLKGRNNTWYNFFSSSNLSVTVLFLHDIYNWRRKVVYGSWMKAIAITAMTGSNHTLKIAYSSDKPSVAEIHIGDDEPTTLRENGALDIGNMKLALSDKHVLSFSNAEWSVEAKNRYLPYHAKNGQKKRLDIRVRPIANADASPVAPHGLVGQMYDRDDLKVIGKLDNYKVPGKVIVTSAMGEGAIEGTADDYIIDATNPFSTNFKFSRFGLSYAPPRNVSSLTGDILPAMGSSKNNAGGVNDEVDN